MLKCSSERWVCAPQSLSAGTFTSPRLSVSLRNSVISFLLFGMHLGPNIVIVLEFNLCSESKNDGMARSSAHVCVVLNDGLQKEHWQWIQKRVEFNAVLRLPSWFTLRHELLTQAILYVTKGHCVMNPHWERLVEPQPCGKHRIVAVDVRRAPVKRNGPVQSPCSTRIQAPERLVRHPVQKVVAGLNHA